MPVMPNWTIVTWPQRGLLIGVLATMLMVATRPTPTGVATSTTLSALLWAMFFLNVLLLLVLGSTAVVTTRRWFREDFSLAQLRRQRRGVRRRAVLLGLMTYVAHQMLVVLLDPRFSLERLTGRRRVFGPVVTLPDRLELAWAFTALALGYIVLAWLLWRSAGVADIVPSDTQPPRSPAVLDLQHPPPLVTAPRADAIEPLPRDPMTGRVIRQFDV
jgi:hypothetical protein